MPMAPRMLASPWPISSWLGSSRWPVFAAMALAMEMASMKPSKEMMAAYGNRAADSIEIEFRQGQGRQPLGDHPDHVAAARQPDAVRLDRTVAHLDPPDKSVVPGSRREFIRGEKLHGPVALRDAPEKKTPQFLPVDVRFALQVFDLKRDDLRVVLGIQYRDGICGCLGLIEPALASVRFAPSRDLVERGIEAGDQLLAPAGMAFTPTRGVVLIADRPGDDGGERDRHQDVGDPAGRFV